MNRQEFFNTAAVTWDRRFHTQELLSFLEGLIPKFRLKQGQKILDVGTGTGILIPFLLKAVGPTGHITAIDFAEKMVEICKAKYARYPNVYIKVERIENLPFPNEAFDALTCFGVFPHLDNKELALAQMNRVLKTGGRLIIVHALSSAEIKAHHHNASPSVAHDTLPEDTEMRALLRQAGFNKIRIVDKPSCYLCLSTKSSRS
jgi:ubiquinone/menaquinone biosynthesis C-methylase UbiE